MGRGTFRVSLLTSVVFAIMVLAYAGGPAAAQTPGEIKGRVLDSQGNAMPGVSITLLHAGAKDTQQQTSGAGGEFAFSGLAGVYIATAAFDGHAPVTCPGVRVIGQSRQLEIRLLPADGSESSSCKVVEPAAGARGAA
ncbi:MAG TPA: carboxypeptidase-like regulatory domain-containing protein [Thermoanaerobaculia bacterium]|nr:carboxypeptidase-like regulatory domain-containing protein [Thermoanaerobaculia bacterium]